MTETIGVKSIDFKQGKDIYFRYFMLLVLYSIDLFYLIVKFYKIVFKLRYFKLKTNLTVQHICECQATISCNEIYLGMLFGNIILLLNYWLLFGDFHSIYFFFHSAFGNTNMAHFSF